MTGNEVSGPHGDEGVTAVLIPADPHRFEDWRFLLESLIELDAARDKFPGEEGALSDAEWLAVLVEEVGEVARAMQDETDVRLREELVQVAAMAARWANALPAGRERVPWSTRTEGVA